MDNHIVKSPDHALRGMPPDGDTRANTEMLNVLVETFIL
jgi:hypothetical protein